MKKILIITYYFWPSTEIGAKRPMRFFFELKNSMKFLPFIITTKSRYYNSKFEFDKSQKVKIDRNIYRTLLVDYRKALSQFKVQALKRDKMYINKSDKEVDNTWSVKKLKATKGIKKLFYTLLWIPDDRLGWLPFATIKALKLIKKENIDVILTTSPPHSVHLIGLILKTLNRTTKWIVDYRDPWVAGNNWKSVLVRTRNSDKIEFFLERYVIKISDMILFATRRMKCKYEQTYAELIKGKSYIIENGFDQKDFKNFRDKKEEKFTIGYFGTFYRGRSPEKILKIISSLIDTGNLNEKNIRIKFYGNCTNIDGTPTKLIAQRYGLENIVSINGVITQQECSKQMQKSHLLLLYAENQPLQVPAKAYEYLASGTPIICFAENGATKDLLNECGQHNIIEKFDEKSVKKIILNYYRKYLENDYRNNFHSEAIFNYENKKIIGKFIKLINNIS